MPPSAQRLDRFDNVIICLAPGRMNVVGNKDGGDRGARFHQTPQRLVFGPVSTFSKKLFYLYVRYLAARLRVRTMHYGSRTPCPVLRQTTRRGGCAFVM